MEDMLAKILDHGKARMEWITQDGQAIVALRIPEPILAHEAGSEWRQELFRYILGEDAQGRKGSKRIFLDYIGMASSIGRSVDDDELPEPSVDNDTTLNISSIKPLNTNRYGEMRREGNEPTSDHHR